MKFSVKQKALALGIRGRIPEDAIIAFTMGEESTNFGRAPEYKMYGAAFTKKFLLKHDIGIKLALVFDITSLDEESGYLTIVRNNFAPKIWNRLLQLVPTFSSRTIFVERKGNNEAIYFGENGILAFNVTIPAITREIHSLEAATTYQRIEHTLQLVSFLLQKRTEWLE